MLLEDMAIAPISKIYCNLTCAIVVATKNRLTFPITLLTIYLWLNTFL